MKKNIKYYGNNRWVPSNYKIFFEFLFNLFILFSINIYTYVRIVNVYFN